MKKQKKKVESAKRVLKDFNPEVDIITYEASFSPGLHFTFLSLSHPLQATHPHSPTHTKENAMELASQYDIIVDGSDNVATRYLTNDVAVLCNKPLVSGAALKWEGQVCFFLFSFFFLSFSSKQSVK